MATGNEIDRRGFFRAGTGTGATLLGVGTGVAIGAESTGAKQPEEEEEVSPNEDLMREHGIVLRIVVIHREILRRLQARKLAPIEAVGETARLVRRFVEDYHEKLEEDHVFSRCEKAGRLVELVGTLKSQHDAGRKITDRVMELCKSGVTAGEESGNELVRLLRAFARMYLPHIGHEDTVLFPAFRALMPREEYLELGEQFEDKEHDLFGEGGFERIVGEVAAFEKKLGIRNLRRFTPKIAL